jgi:uncharacterized membrane protein
VITTILAILITTLVDRSKLKTMNVNITFDAHAGRFPTDIPPPLDYYIDRNRFKSTMDQCTHIHTDALVPLYRYTRNNLILSIALGIILLVAIPVLSFGFRFDMPALCAFVAIVGTLFFICGHILIIYPLVRRSKIAKQCVEESTKVIVEFLEKENEFYHQAGVRFQAVYDEDNDDVAVINVTYPRVEPVYHDVVLDMSGATISEDITHLISRYIQLKPIPGLHQANIDNELEEKRLLEDTPL